MKFITTDGHLALTDKRTKIGKTVSYWSDWYQANKSSFWGCVLLGALAGCILGVTLYQETHKGLGNPLSQRETPVKTTAEAAVVQLPTPTPTDVPVAIRKWRGIASYYSRSGCLGCSPNLTMANGQPLDDNALTVAFNKLPLGSKVRILNAKNMMTVEAVVTDRGGFERLGRIIDVTPKVKSMLNCSDLCEVIVEQI